MFCKLHCCGGLETPAEGQEGFPVRTGDYEFWYRFGDGVIFVEDVIAVWHVVLVVVGVIAIAYFIASGNGWTEGHTLKDAAGYDLGIGTDLATRKVFGPFEYMMADTSIIVTYITIAGAALAAVFSAIRGIYKS